MCTYLGHKNVAMDVISCLDVHNLMEEIILNAYFPKIVILTHVHEKDHNLACDQHFFFKPSPFCSAQTELSVNAKNEISQVPPFLIAGHISSLHVLKHCAHV